jgi:hypothetical protein
MPAREKKISAQLNSNGLTHYLQIQSNLKEAFPGAQTSIASLHAPDP